MKTIQNNRAGRLIPAERAKMKRLSKALQALGFFGTMFWASGADSMETVTIIKGIAICIAIIFAGLIGERISEH